MTSTWSAFGLHVAGLVSLAIGIGHIAFPRLFGWQAEFLKITALNARVFTTLHMATLLFLIGSGALTFRYAGLLAQSTEAATVTCLFLFGFWGWRLVWQFFYFKPFTAQHHHPLQWLHWLLVLLFATAAVGYGVPLVR